MSIRQMEENRAPFIMKLREEHLYPSLQTEERWQNLLDNLGHYRPCRRTGNNRASVLRDHDLILLALYRAAFPKARADQINAFLYKANYGSLSFRFYSPSQISLCEKLIGLTRKCGSTTAYQALLPRNIRKRWCYWNLPYPFGIADIERKDLIDMDECGVELATANTNIGKAFIGKRVNQAGLYSKTDKYNLLLAISGDPNGMRWKDIWTGEGTTGERMIAFISTILRDLGPGTSQRRFCFIMDNLRYVSTNDPFYLCIALCMHTLIFSQKIAAHITIFRWLY